MHEFRMLLHAGVSRWRSIWSARRTQITVDIIAASIVIWFALDAWVLKQARSGGGIWGLGTTAASREVWAEAVQRQSFLGPQDAEPGLVEFVDYQCVWCKAVHLEVIRLASGQAAMKVIVLHRPLDRLHPAAHDAARAAICAEGQGKFPEMHDVLLESLDARAADADWAELASMAGVLQRSVFEQCLRSSEPDLRIARDLGLAERLGVTGTPTFLRPGGVVGGLPSVEEPGSSPGPARDGR